MNNENVRTTEQHLFSEAFAVCSINLTIVCLQQVDPKVMQNEDYISTWPNFLVSLGSNSETAVSYRNLPPG
ncbi:hypothetical protein GDO81_016401 [Engystomops pustulosus]|uniref:Uncharacterized protein n=1 Tax=Engystomops pustulosus TaxID=76066 RepID=A0AAV7AU39_ENGPU|nr:hypothetical protein GDO81_016401 [Engystomops pustulosus]